MQFVKAEGSGFCFGVRRAVDMVEEQLGFGPLYTLGKIIHNDTVVEYLKSKGAQPVGSIEEVEDGATVVIRSHGAAKSVYDYAGKHSIKLIDATCTFVARIHRIVEKCSAEGRLIVVVGKSSHPEVQGICGWSGRHIVVENIAEAENVSAQSACVVAQTTARRQLFEQCVDVLSANIEDIRIYNTICDTTENRQKSADELSKKVDRVIVIGGKDSSNTRELYQICKNNCEKTYLMSRANESTIENLSHNDIIGIVAGASTPHWMIREVITTMTELDNTTAEQTVQEQVVEQEPEVMQEAAAEPVQAAAQESTTLEEPKTPDANLSYMEQVEQSMVTIRNGQIVKGTVVQISDSEVCVNIGYKSDGLITKQEFSSDQSIDLLQACKVGDELEVEVLKVNDGEGNVSLSRKSVEQRAAWDAFIEDAQGDRVFESVGKEAVKGGLIAYIDGVRAFIPASQISIKYVENISDFVGKPLKLKVIDIDKIKRRIVASQKAVLIEEAAAKKKEIWDSIVEGSIIKGTVRRLSDFGAFVDIGGVDGLVHVTELAWHRVKHPSEVLKINDEIDVQVLNVDPVKERVSLGYKQLQPKPWASAEERYPVGSVVECKVVRIVPFGAFVALEPTIDGLVHISQVAMTRIEKVEDELKIGDVIRAKVIEVNGQAKRISLSRKEVLLDERPEPVHQEREYEQGQESEDERIEIPPIESATTSLADLFKSQDDE